MYAFLTSFLDTELMSVAKAEINYPQKDTVRPEKVAGILQTPNYNVVYILVQIAQTFIPKYPVNTKPV